MHAGIEMVVARFSRCPCWLKERMESVLGIIEELNSKDDRSRSPIFEGSSQRADGPCGKTVSSSNVKLQQKKWSGPYKETCSQLEASMPEGRYLENRDQAMKA